MFIGQIKWYSVSENCPDFNKDILMICPNNDHTWYEIIRGEFVAIPWYGTEWTVYSSCDGAYPLDCLYWAYIDLPEFLNKDRNK